jgi:hypothetical protein
MTFLEKAFEAMKKNGNKFIEYIHLMHDIDEYEPGKSHDTVTFTIQSAPVKEVGVNGCQVTDIIEYLICLLHEYQKEFPCAYNCHTITHLREAQFAQENRTKDREARGVEGENKE